MSLQLPNLPNYDPERQHLEVTQDNALNVAQGSVSESFGLGLAATLTQGRGWSQVDNVHLEKNAKQVALLNSKLAEALVNLTPGNLNEVIRLTKYVHQIGKAAHVGCSLCGVELVRTDALHNYNDRLEGINGISSRYLAIFETLAGFGASDQQICDIVQWIVKRDEILPLDVKLFANRQDFVQGLSNIAADSHNIPLEDWIVTLIHADEQKIKEFDLHTAAGKDRTIPDEIWPLFSKLYNSFAEMYRLADLTTTIFVYRNLDPEQLKKFEKDWPDIMNIKNWSEDQILELVKHKEVSLASIAPNRSPKPIEEFQEIRKILRTNPDAILKKYDTLMKEAKKLSDIVVKKLLLLDSDRRMTALCANYYYLFRLFFVFPQIYRCCVQISGEEKAFLPGTIQSRWRDSYHEFRELMCTVLNDPRLENLRRKDQRFANYLAPHDRVGHLYFDATPT